MRPQGRAVPDAVQGESEGERGSQGREERAAWGVGPARRQSCVRRGIPFPAHWALLTGCQAATHMAQTRHRDRTSVQQPAETLEPQ